MAQRNKPKLERTRTMSRNDLGLLYPRCRLQSTVAFGDSPFGETRDHKWPKQRWGNKEEATFLFLDGGNKEEATPDWYTRIPQIPVVFAFRVIRRFVVASL